MHDDPEPSPLSRVAEPPAQWQLQEAKNRLSAVVKAAQVQPQVVTVHGQPAAVVLSPQSYAALLQAQPAVARLSEWLACPMLRDEDGDVFERDRSSNLRRDSGL